MAEQTQVQLLNTNVAELTKALQSRGIQFAEPAQGTQNGYAMDMGGLFRVQAGGNLIVIALGIALSSMVTGFFSKFLPFGSGGIAKLIVGFVLKKFIAKSGAFADFATGIILAGVAELAGGLTGGLAGMFSEKTYPQNRNPSLISYNEPTPYPAMAPVAWR